MPYSIYVSYYFNKKDFLLSCFFRGRGVDHTVVVYDLNRGARNTRDIQSTTFEANVSEKVYGISWFKLFFVFS